MKKLLVLAAPAIGAMSYLIYTALTTVGGPEAWHFH
jgi:hypothetical protein